MYSLDQNHAHLNETQSQIRTRILNERYCKNLGILLIVSLLVYSIYVSEQQTRVGFDERSSSALAIIWLGFFPFIQYLFDPQRPPMPFFPLVGLFYATGFGLPALSTLAESYDPASQGYVSNEAVIITSLGLITLNIGFYITKVTLWKNISPLRFSQNYSTKKLLRLLWIILLLNTAIRYVPTMRSIPSLSNFVNGSLFLVYGIFYIINYQNRIPKWQKWLLVLVFLPIEIIPRLASGSLAQLMTLFLYMFNIIWYLRKRIPIIFVTILIVLYLGLAPVKGIYRERTWSNGSGSQLNSFEQFQLFVNLAVEYHQTYTFKSESIPQARFKENNSGVDRAVQITLLSKVMRDTPERVPYWNGETYLPLITSFIPRVFWPDKPQIRTGNDFGRRYGYLSQDDFSTSYNLPWIVELFINFGEAGIIWGMGAVGIFLSFLDKKFNNFSMTPIEFSAGCAIIYSLVFQESNFALMVGGVIPLAASIIILFKYIIRYI